MLNDLMLGVLVKKNKKKPPAQIFEFTGVYSVNWLIMVWSVVCSSTTSSCCFISFRVLVWSSVGHHGEGKAPHQHRGDRTRGLGEVHHHRTPDLQVWRHRQTNHREVWEGGSRSMAGLVFMTRISALLSGFLFYRFIYKCLLKDSENVISCT